MLGGLIRSQDRPSRQVSKRDKMGTAAGGWGGDLPTKSDRVKIKRKCASSLLQIVMNN